MQSRNWRLIAVCGAALGAFVAAGCGEGQTATGAASFQGRTQPGEDSDRARELLKEARTFYRETERLQGTISFTMEAPGEQAKSTMTFIAAQPNRVAIDLVDAGRLEYALYSDGQRLHQYLGGGLDIYSEEEAPADFTAMMQAAMLGHETDSSALMTPYMLGLGLVSGIGFDMLVADADRVVHVGSEDLDGKPHQIVRLESDTIDFNLWIADGDERWVSRLVPDLTPMLEELRSLLGEQADELVGEAPQVMVNLSWSVPAEVAAESFAFSPPEGAEQVASIGERLRELSEAHEEQQGGGAHAAMLGQPAPELDLQLLDGGRAMLADHQDQVVILDFWATWCGPCVRALPIVTSVAERYREQGVVLYAVNVAEAEGTVQRFLDGQDFTVKVPMDKEGRASTSYGVTGLPQMVLIGRDGTVQSVHRGLLPDLEERLSREIEQLLKGERLVDG